MTIPHSDILFINPPSGIFYGLGPNFAPMGLFSMSAWLRGHGIKALILNANYFPNYINSPVKIRPDTYYYAEDHESVIWDMVMDFIRKTDPKMVGFSCHDLSVGGIRYLARMIKEESPQRLLAVGGATPTGAPDAFDGAGEIDFLLAGEGEMTILELYRSLEAESFSIPENPAQSGPEQLKNILGLYLYDGHKFVYNGPREHLANLDDLPDPDREYFWLDYEKGQIVKDVQLNGLATSRGCLKACRFCGARTIWPGPVRYRAISRVVDEICELRKKYGFDFQYFSILDDDFLSRPERVFNFCQKIKALGDDYKFRCYGRVNNLQDEEIVETLIKTGCQEIWVGVESGSQKILKALGKGITVKQIKRLDRLFYNYDFPWLAFIILGSPEETEDDIKETLRVLEEGHFPSIQPFTFHPYSGTELFRELKAMGRIDYDDIIRGHQNLPLCFSPKMSPASFFELYNQLCALAEARIKKWQNDYLLKPEEEIRAREFENKIFKLLVKKGPGLVFGPERYLRWLSALLYYRGAETRLILVDLEAKDNNQTRFGTVLDMENLKTTDVWRSADLPLMVIAPEDVKLQWQNRVEAVFGRKAQILVTGQKSNFRGVTALIQD